MSGATPNGFSASVVSVTTSATQLAAARTDRRKVKLVMHGAADVFIGPTDQVTTATGVLLVGTKGTQMEIETTAAIWAVAGGTVAVGVIDTHQ